MAENNINDRKQRISQMFKLSGEPFIKALLQEFRNDRKPFDQEFMVRNQMKEIPINDHKCYLFKSSDPITENPGNKKILYLHGGGFVCPAGPQHFWFCEYLSKNTGAEIWLPDYPLAPEHSGLEAIEMLEDIYHKMIKDTSPENLFIMGDSAGGALSLSLSMLLRDHGIQQPKHIIAISPAVDLMAKPESGEEELYKKLIESDEIVSPNSMPVIAKYWYGSLPATDYRVSPIHGSTEGLAPITIFISKDEVCYLAYLHFVKSAKESKADIDFYEKSGVPHTWIVYPDYPAENERRLIVSILNK